MTTEEREVTVNEFWRLCNHSKRGYEVSYESTQPFLDRCCKVGLLTKRQDAQIVRYSPTSLLLYLLPEVEGE